MGEENELANEATAELAALTERVRVLEALVKYARHDNDCGIYPCDCGFNAVFNERAALHSPPAQAGQAEGG